MQYGTGSIIRHDHTETYNCGYKDEMTDKPCHDIGNGTDYCSVWASNFVSQGNRSTGIRCNTNGNVVLRDFYFENGASAPYVYVDATDGVATISRGQMNANGATSIILGTFLAAQNGPSIEDVSINNFPGANNPHIHVLAGGAVASMNNVRIFGHTNHTGTSIQWDGSYGRISNVIMNTTGRFSVTAAFCEIANIYVYNCRTSSTQYAIDIGDNSIRGSFIDGANVSTCHGISVADGSVVDCEVRALNGGNGIVSSSDGSVIANCHSHSHINGGTPFVFTNGNVATGNKGYPTTGTAAAGAATLHAESGVITSEALTTGTGASYTLTLTNQLIAAGSRVQVSVSRGSEADSLSYQVQEVEPAAAGGSCTIVIKNTGSVPFGDGLGGGGTIKIAFQVVN